MHNIDQVIRSISGHYDRRCYEALHLAAADIWACGCRARLEQIYGRPLLEPPTAKNLIFTLAEYCGNRTDHTYVLTEQQLKRLLQVLR